jgi:hypothetical protein
MACLLPEGVPEQIGSCILFVKGPTKRTLPIAGAVLLGRRQLTRRSRTKRAGSARGNSDQS